MTYAEANRILAHDGGGAITSEREYSALCNLTADGRLICACRMVSLPPPTDSVRSQYWGQIHTLADAIRIRATW